MSLPIQLRFFKKLDLYQDFSQLDRMWKPEENKAWNAEKEILKWAAYCHHHLGTSINELYVQGILKNDGTAGVVNPGVKNPEQYDNFPDDAKRPMENLIKRGFFEGTTSDLTITPEGLIMAHVIYELTKAQGKILYRFNYVMTWVTIYAAAIVAIGAGAKALWEIGKAIVAFFALWI